MGLIRIVVAVVVGFTLLGIIGTASLGLLFGATTVDTSRTRDQVSPSTEQEEIPTNTPTPTPRGDSPTDDDGDGLTGAGERQYDGDPEKADTDGDGLDDGQEVELGTSLRAIDTDDDGVADPDELDLRTDPTETDTDGDGLADGMELEGGFDPLDPDMDSDGLDDGKEHSLGSELTNVDSDGDGVPDGKEVAANADPLEENSDSDGLSDAEELEVGTAPDDPDSDEDGLDDYLEVKQYGSDPTTADMDGDGLLDGREVELETNFTDPDTDSDNLMDAWEVDGETPRGAELPDADPLHKDLYLELVYDRRARDFSSRERSKLVDAWDDMPIGNPDRRDGVTVHITEVDAGREFATDKTASYFYFNHYRSWNSSRRGVYHRMFVIPMDDRYRLGGQALGPGKVSFIDSTKRGDPSYSRWAVAIHELLHNVVGDIDEARTCKDNSHTCEGWLAPSIDKMSHHLPYDLAEEIEAEGLAER